MKLLRCKKPEDQIPSNPQIINFSEEKLLRWKNIANTMKVKHQEVKIKSDYDDYLHHHHHHQHQHLPVDGFVSWLRSQWAEWGGQQEPLGLSG